MGMYHGWSHDPDSHADFVRGGVTPEDFDEAPIRHKKKAKSKPKKKRGCPENDFGPHVYVWEPSTVFYEWLDYTDTFYAEHGFHRREFKICCGCGKRMGSRYTEEMKRRIEKKGWYGAHYG